MPECREPISELGQFASAEITKNKFIECFLFCGDASRDAWKSCPSATAVRPGHRVCGGLRPGSRLSPAALIGSSRTKGQCINLDTTWTGTTPPCCAPRSTGRSVRRKIRGRLRRCLRQSARTGLADPNAAQLSDHRCGEIRRRKRSNAEFKRQRGTRCIYQYRHVVTVQHRTYPCFTSRLLRKPQLAVLAASCPAWYTSAKIHQIGLCSIGVRLGTFLLSRTCRRRDYAR